MKKFIQNLVEKPEGERPLGNCEINGRVMLISVLRK
jgi:hypothetical protein